MFEIEKELLKAGKKIVIGIDEVGRGPLAGDVVAAAVCVDRPFHLCRCADYTAFGRHPAGERGSRRWRRPHGT